MGSSRTILPKEVIEKVQSKYMERTGYFEFSYRGLCKDLTLFVKEKEIPLRKYDLYENFMNGRNLKEKTIRDALTRNAHSNSGVTTKMRNLLCYYGYDGLLWKQTLEHLGLIEEEIVRESRKLKSMKYEEVSNAHTENMAAHAKTQETLTELLNKYRGVDVDEEREKIILEAIRNDNIEEVLPLMQKISDETSKKIQDAKLEMAVHLLSFAMISQKAEDHLKCIAYIDEALGIVQNNSVAHFIKARSLAFMKKYDEALIEVDQSLKIEPQFGQAYILKGCLYFLLDDTAKAQEEYTTPLILMGMGKILTFDQVLLKLQGTKESLENDEDEMRGRLRAIMVQQFMTNMTIFLADRNDYDGIRGLNGVVTDKMPVDTGYTFRQLLIFFAGWIKAIADDNGKMGMDKVIKNIPKDITEAKAFYRELIWF